MNKLIIVVTLLTITFLNAITLEEAKQVGLENNYTFSSAQNSKKSATSQKLQAYSAILPSLTARGTHSGDDLDMDDKNYSLTLKQPIFQGGSILYGMKIANSQESIAENNYLKAKVDLLTDIENKYFSVLEASSLLEVSKENLKRANIQLEIAQTRYQLGAISRSDFLQFQLEKSQSDVSLFSSEKQYKTLLKDFNNYLNSINEIPTAISIKIPLEEAKHISDLNIKQIEDKNNQIKSFVLHQNIDLKNSEESVKTSKSYLNLSKTSFLPSIDFSLSRNWAENSQTDGLQDSDTYSLNFSWDLFPLVDKGFSYKTKKYDFNNSVNNHESIQNNVTLQAESAWLDLITSAKNLLAAEISLNHATNLYEQSNTEFTLGELSSSDFLASSISLSNSESQYYTAVYNYLRSKASLNQLLCEENYSELNKLIFNTNLNLKN